jgi:hypothetical protein
MKVVGQSSIEIIEHDGATYERSSEGCWCQVIGESGETVFGRDAERLEAVYQSAVMARGAVAANPEPPWVSVDNALPIPFERVLVFDLTIPRFRSRGRVRSFNHVEIGYVSGPQSLLPGWYVPNGEFSPTHWMPLPKYPADIESNDIDIETSDSIAILPRQVGQSGLSSGLGFTTRFDAGLR